MIFKIVAIGLLMNEINLTRGALLESNRQNTGTGDSAPYEKYSHHTRELITQSRDEGHAEGHAAGRVEGIEEGRILEKIALAREMIAHRLEVNLIMEIAKLTREEIEALQRGERLAIEKKLEAERGVVRSHE
jgi:hypothetical protein